MATPSSSHGTPFIINTRLIGRSSPAECRRYQLDQPPSRPTHGGFTLFEVILAVALSAALFALIGTAINLYLMRIEADRSEVEEAQLARTILGTIAADIRATTVYQPQDMGTIGQLMAAAAEFDVDSIDDPSGGGGGGSGGESSSSSGSTGSGETQSGSTQISEVVPLGINGLFYEMSLDVSRLPKSDELFSVVTGYTNAPSMVAGAAPAPGTTDIVRPSDVKTVRYFLRQGVQVDPGSVSATSLAPEEQLRASGLVRQEIDRATRNYADVSGDQALLETGQKLLAPEVVKIEFRYFDGANVTDTWDMIEREALPVAIDVRIWLVSSFEAASQNISSYYADPSSYAREYRQTVYLPMSAIASAGTSGAGSSNSSTDSQSSSESSSDSGDTGSGFGMGTGTGGGTGSGFGSGSGFGQSQ